MDHEVLVPQSKLNNSLSKKVIPPHHKWRLNGVRTFKEEMEKLMVLASIEDAYIESLITDIRNRPTYKNFSEDKDYLMWLSSIVNQIHEIKPDYVFTPTKCTAFLSKLHNEHMSFNIETEFQNKKLQFMTLMVIRIM